MKSIQMTTALAIFAIVCAFASEASAQRGNRGGMRGMMQNMNRLMSRMLAMDEVQEELKFTDEQKEEIGDKAKELAQEMMGEMRDMFQGGGADPTEMTELIEEYIEKEKELVAKLDDGQKKRLSQLKYQQMRMGIFQDKNAVEKLGLTDEQKTAIADAMEAMQTKRAQAMREAMESGDRGGMRELIQDLDAELRETVMAELTDEQKKTLEELKGEPFEFPRRGRGGGRRSDF